MTAKFITAPSKKATSENNLAVTHPDIAAQWSDRNPVSPFECTAGSHFNALWVCDKGHEYDSIIYRRTKGNGCPYCSNRKVLIGFNDLMTTHPDIAAQWSDRNPISPFECTAGSGMRAWWVCDLGHEYDSVICSRSKGTGCPYCFGQKVLAGFNDLSTTHPEIAKELIDEKNGGILATHVSKGSEKKLWWKCDMGHEYKTRVYNRTSGERGCVLCKGNKSIGEQEVSQLVSELVSSEVILNSRSVISPYELDMYIPDKNLAIEFNGVYWHTEAQGKDKSYHYNKWKMCKDAGIDLVTVWEDSWRDNREVVETMLRSKLGVYDVNACDLTVVDVKTFREANDFFSVYHLYGSNLGNHTSALVDNAGSPVAMLSWYQLDNIVYVDKYASSCAVENGLSTLLDQVKKFAVVNGCEKIVGMSDNEFSVDDVYELCGFDRVGDVGARCWEVYDNTRYLNDDYGGNNIWDCGRVQWECVV